MKARQLLFLALIAGCVGCSTAPAPDTTAQDEASIKALEDRFVAAFNAKDTAAIMMLYVPDQSLIVFDASPPRQYTGANAYKKDWDGFFTGFPGPMNFTLSDLDITVGGNVAYSHSIQHVTTTDQKGNKVEFTVRVTDGYKKINGQWLISHEHVSVPVDFDTMKPDLNSK
jgi:uncharacterized protein (TIGR02246 family)